MGLGWAPVRLLAPVLLREHFSIAAFPIGSPMLH
jgi:hypothetical protein